MGEGVREGGAEEKKVGRENDSKGVETLLK